MSETKNIYNLPISKDLVSSTVTDTESHQGVYEGSIDFAVALGSPVLAAANGVVSRVRDDSERHGQDPSFGADVNYITIEHDNDELSEYLHLAKDSALVKPGDQVVSGQQLAITGLSGWLYAPHLHFMVYSKNTNFQCLQVRFGP